MEGQVVLFGQQVDSAIRYSLAKVRQLRSDSDHPVRLIRLSETKTSHSEADYTGYLITLDQAHNSTVAAHTLSAS